MGGREWRQGTAWALINVHGHGDMGISAGMAPVPCGTVERKGRERKRLTVGPTVSVSTFLFVPFNFSRLQEFNCGTKTFL